MQVQQKDPVRKDPVEKGFFVVPTDPAASRSDSNPGPAGPLPDAPETGPARLSIVVPCYNEQEVIDETHRRLSDL